MPKRLSFVRQAVPLIALVLAACSGDLMNPGTNTPAVGMNPGQFGFAISARSWTSDQTYEPDFSVNALQIGLAISGYDGGTGQLTITDADGAVAFSQSLAGNVAQGSNFTVTGRPPFRIRIAAANYTGVIALGVNSAPATN